MNSRQEKEPFVSKQESATAVSTVRWESLKREFFLRTHRGETIFSAPDAAPEAQVADPYDE